MRCARVRENLTAYQLGLLDELEAVEMRQHLDECPECREELATLQRLDELIQPAEEHDAPEGMWTRVQAHMKPRRRSWWRAWREAPKPALALAAAMLLAVGGIWLAMRAGPGDVGSREMLASEYQEQQIAAQWSQPLADDAALGAMYASLEGAGETQ